jgi:hypothetical protein
MQSPRGSQDTVLVTAQSIDELPCSLAANPADAADNITALIILWLNFIGFSLLLTNFI